MQERYQRLELIGRGVSSLVYKGFDHLTKSTVAIKVLNPHMITNSIAIERFRRELQITREIQDSRIISIFDFIERGSEKFLVMEYLDGLDLKTFLLGQKVMSMEGALDLMMEILKVTDLCHRRGILHRDIKPQNIFILNNKKIKLLDFGISRMADQTEITLAGTTMGSPEYMAPELFDMPRFDVRTDIYALGVLFYEILVGELPFQSDSITALYHQHLRQPIPPIRQKRPEVTEWLEQIIYGMMAKDPIHRYQGIEEIFVDLDAKKVLRQNLKKLKMKYCLDCGNKSAIALEICLSCGHSFLKAQSERGNLNLYSANFHQSAIGDFFEKICSRKLPRITKDKDIFIISDLSQKQAHQIISLGEKEGLNFVAFEKNLMGYYKRRPWRLGVMLASGILASGLTEKSFILFLYGEVAPLIEGLDPFEGAVLLGMRWAVLILFGFGIWFCIDLLIDLVGVRQPWLSKGNLIPGQSVLSQSQWLRPYINTIVQESRVQIKKQLLHLIENYIYLASHEAFSEATIKADLQGVIVYVLEVIQSTPPNEADEVKNEKLTQICNEVSLKFNLIIGRTLVLNQPFNEQDRLGLKINRLSSPLNKEVA